MRERPVLVAHAAGESLARGSAGCAAAAAALAVTGLCGGIARLLDSQWHTCLQSMFNHVREEHHMHHQGRLQLGLFLKVPPMCSFIHAVE